MSKNREFVIKAERVSVRQEEFGTIHGRRKERNFRQGNVKKAQPSEQGLS